MQQNIFNSKVKDIFHSTLLAALRRDLFSS